MPSKNAPEQRMYIKIPFEAQTPAEARKQAEGTLAILRDYPWFSAALTEALISSDNDSNLEAAYHLLLILNPKHDMSQLIAALEEVSEIRLYESVMPDENSEKNRIAGLVKEALNNRPSTTLLTLFEEIYHTRVTAETLSSTFRDTYLSKLELIDESRAITFPGGLRNAITRAFTPLLSNKLETLKLTIGDYLENITVEEFVNARQLNAESIATMFLLIHQHDTQSMSVPNEPD